MKTKFDINNNICSKNGICDKRIYDLLLEHPCMAEN